MAGQECTVVKRTRTDDSFELGYVAYKDGKFLYVRDATRIADDDGGTGRYIPSKWKYLVKFENTASLSEVYMLVNDNTVTYERIMSSLFSSDAGKHIKSVLLYWVK